MKIYCISVFTDVSDYCGFGGNIIVSTKRAIENHVSYVKKRIISILSKKPYLRDYPVYVSVKVEEPNSDGIFIIVSHYTIQLQINVDDSFKRSLKVH